MRPSTNVNLLYQCIDCPFRSPWDFSFGHHRETHNTLQEVFNCSVKVEKHKCNGCEFETSLEKHLTKHAEKNCRSTENLTLDQELTPTYAATGNHKFKCPRCDLRTASALFFLIHCKGRCGSQFVRKTVVRNRTFSEALYDLIYLDLDDECSNGDNKSPKNSNRCEDKPSEESESNIDRGHSYSKRDLLEPKIENGSLKNIILLKHAAFEGVTGFKCNSCSFQVEQNSIQKSSLKLHILKKHADPEKITSFLSRYMSFKPTVRLGFKCKACFYQAKKEHHLKCHVLLKHSVLVKRAAADDVAWLQCDKCPYKTRNERRMASHVTRKHTTFEAITWVKCEIKTY